MTAEADPGGQHRATTDWTPQRKVMSGAVSGATAILILWVVGLTGVDVPAEVAGAITALVTAGVAYWVPGETAPEEG